MDLALNNQQRLICHKTQQTNQPTIISRKKCVSVIIFNFTNEFLILNIQDYNVLMAESLDIWCILN